MGTEINDTSVPTYTATVAHRIPVRVLQLSIGKDPRLGLTRICPLRHLHLGRIEINLDVFTSHFASELQLEQDVYALQVLETRIHIRGMTNQLSLR